MFLHGEKVSYTKSQCFTEYANFLLDKKDIEKARKVYDKAIALEADNPYAYTGLALTQMEMESFEEALQSCSKAISIQPSGRRFVLQCVIYESLRDNLKARKAIQEALKYYDDNLSTVYNRIAHTYYELSMYDMAEYYCNELVKMYPNSNNALLNLDRIHKARQAGKLRSRR